MILVDSSAWIEFDRASDSAVDRALSRLIALEAGSLAATEPVLMEVLAGAPTESQVGRLRAILTSFGWIACDPVADFEGAAGIYRQCRSRGITPRSLCDCLIANVALRHDAELLTADRDFEQIARVVPLRLYPV